MHFDEKFWLAIAFLTFTALILKFVGPAISKMLNAASQKIVDEMSKAREMRKKAAELLVQAEKFHQESSEYAKRMIEDAKIEAQRLINLTTEAIESEVKKKTDAVLERVKVEEERAIRDIKSDIILTSIKIMNEQIAKDMGERNHEHLVDQAIKDFAKVVH